VHCFPSVVLMRSGEVPTPVPLRWRRRCRATGTAFPMIDNANPGSLPGRPHGPRPEGRVFQLTDRVLGELLRPCGRGDVGVCSRFFETDGKRTFDRFVHKCFTVATRSMNNELARRNATRGTETFRWFTPEEAVTAEAWQE